MKTNFFKAIASDTSFLRILHDVTVDKVSKTATYRKLGEIKTITGDKYHRLASLVYHNKQNNINRMAMSLKYTSTGKTFIVIDRTFYNEF